MDVQTVSTVSREHGVSTRMLRYYEQCGLIESMRKDGYSYRIYDELNQKRLQQVIILRKLQIPIKQICVILDNPNAVTVVEIFKESILEIDSEITALSTIRKILDNFISELEATANVNLNILRGDSVLEMTGSLSLVQKNIKERTTMSELNQAAEILNERNNAKVRVELAYNGNCAEAIALYEKAFGIKAEGVLKYKDAPPEDGTQHPKGTEDYVMHTWLKIGNDVVGEIGMHDRMPGKECNYGDGVSVSVGLSSADAVKTAFNVLKEGGVIGVAPETAFFCECYCEVKDKFGICWIVMYN